MRHRVELANGLRMHFGPVENEDVSAGRGTPGFHEETSGHFASFVRGGYMFWFKDKDGGTSGGITAEDAERFVDSYFHLVVLGS